MWTGERALGAGYSIRAAEVEPGDTAKCTRYDVAFDFHCDVGLDPVELVQGWGWLPGNGWKLDGIQAAPKGDGRPISWTWYLGSMSSPRRVRIYRKDIESGFGSPRVRVEMVLREQYAQEALTRDLEGRKVHVRESRCSLSVIRFAAGVLLDITGFRVADDVDEIRVRKSRERSDMSKLLAVMAEQYTKPLVYALEKGLDLSGLVNEVVQAKGRTSRYELRKCLEAANEYNQEEVLGVAVSTVRERREMRHG